MGKSEIVAAAIVLVMALAFVQGVVGIGAVVELLAAVMANRAPEFIAGWELVK